MQPQQTVAGRLSDDQIFYATFRGRDAARRALNTLRHGYRSVDGLIVETIGVVDDALHAAIATQCQIQESYERTKASVVRKKREARRFWH